MDDKPKTEALETALASSAAAGDQSVLLALAATVANLQSIDLTSSPPSAASGLPSSGRYDEQRELGRGGLGVVLQAYDNDLRRTVALKRPLSVSAKNVMALTEEAQITAQLEHPNIIPVHTLGIDAQGRPFFTMTQVRGMSLADILAQRREDPELRRTYSLARLLRIFLQMGYAIAFAHARGVLHRDIKPANVMVGEFGEVLVMDWGIAKLLDRADLRAGEQLAAPQDRVSVSVDHEPTERTILGTVLYAAPEQLRAEPDIDCRADIYALGGTLYQMICGQAPVVGESVTEVMDHVQAGKLVPLKSLVPVSDALAAIVHKALALSPDERYQDVPAMLADVEALLQGGAVSALHENVLERLGRWYFARTPQLARFRTIDFDLVCGSCFALGMGLALILLQHFGWLAWAGWPLLAAGMAAGIYPAHTYLRKPRADDPGTLLPFGEDVTHRSQPRTGPSGRS